MLLLMATTPIIRVNVNVLLAENNKDIFRYVRL